MGRRNYQFGGRLFLNTFLAMSFLSASVSSATSEKLYYKCDVEIINYVVLENGHDSFPPKENETLKVEIETVDGKPTHLSRYFANQCKIYSNAISCQRTFASDGGNIKTDEVLYKDGRYRKLTETHLPGGAVDLPPSEWSI